MAALPFWRRAANIVFRASKWTIHTVLLCLTLLASILLLASAFSDLVSPTVWVAVAFLGLVFPITLTVCLLWLIFLLITHRWKLSIILGVTFLLCSGRIWQYCPIHLSQPEPITNVMIKDGKESRTPIDSLRVMTFNTKMLGDAKINKKETEIPIMDMIHDCGADVVLLQEYHFSTNAKAYTKERLHGLIKDKYPYTDFVLNYGSKTSQGIAIFSKWPLKVKDEIDLSGKVNYHAGYYVIKFKGREVVIVNCHLSSNAISKENRAIYREQTKHFEVDSLKRMEQGMRQLAPSFISRTNQVAAINKYLKEHEKEGIGHRPTIICGDLNDTPNSFAYRALKGDLVDTWEEAGRGPGITFRDAPFWFRIDHIFHSKHFRTLDVKVLRDEKNSDHYPVMATYQLLPADE